MIFDPWDKEDHHAGDVEDHHAGEAHRDHLGADDDDAGEQHHGQVRMAYRLAAEYGDRLMHVHGLGWHAWDGQRWIGDDRGEAKRAVLDVLRAALAD